jgi:biopolymer transport protein ExbD
MKLRKKHVDEKIELSMTALIDIVFLLLAFFVMTFKVSAQEGDFNIRMPTPGNGSAADTSEIAMKLRLRSDGNGNLQEIILNENLAFGTDFNALRGKIVELVGDTSGPTESEEGPEVEIDLDYDLQYKYIISAITSVTGYRSGDNVVRLIQRIKFAPVRK